jgi:hypothetical protein
MNHRLNDLMSTSRRRRCASIARRLALAIGIASSCLALSWTAMTALAPPVYAEDGEGGGDKPPTTKGCDLGNCFTGGNVLSRHARANMAARAVWEPKNADSSARC